MSSPTIAYLQQYLRGKDYKGGNPDPYFYKLIEEVGELSKSLFNGAPHATDESFKGSVEEELWDVMYYILCIANELDIDLEKWIAVKEEYNNRRYNPDARYDPK